MKKLEGVPKEKVLPVDRVRGLAAEAQAKKAREAAEEAEAKQGRYRELVLAREGHRESVDKEWENLIQATEALAEIVQLEKDGITSDALKELQTKLEENIRDIGMAIEVNEREIQAIAADPLVVEMREREAEEQAARSKEERSRQQAERERENGEKVKRAMETLRSFIDELNTAVDDAESHEKDIRTFQKKKEAAEKVKNELAKTIETEIGSLLHALPEQQQRAIAGAVRKAREAGAEIYSSEGRSRDSAIVYTPAASTASEWFGAWIDEVKPSIIPFFDKPLRALRDFVEDNRWNDFHGAQANVQEYDRRIAALFLQRKTENNAYMKRFLQEGSLASKMNEDALRVLHDTEGADRTKIDEMFDELTRLRTKLPYLLAGLEDDLYRQYEKSNFAKTGFVRGY